MNLKRRILLVLLSLGVVALLQLAVKDKARNVSHQSVKVEPVDLSIFSDASPGKSLRLLFIHHSCGGQLLATQGSDNSTNGIYQTHPNGGGLRSRLEQNGYSVHEASYGSEIGEHTDIFDWLPKFRSQMNQILGCDFQDEEYSNGDRNEIVAFKSCFPNNAFVGEGTPPGDPAGPELNVWNAKASYAALLDEFRKYPDTLFVCLTTPPLAQKNPPQPLWKNIAKTILGRQLDRVASAHSAREFSSWLVSKDGWLKNYDLPNVVVFDYYDILTEGGSSDFCAYPTGNGYDSHPNSVGNRKAAEAFVPFLNRAVDRAGLTQNQPNRTAESNRIKPNQT